MPNHLELSSPAVLDESSDYGLNGSSTVSPRTNAPHGVSKPLCVDLDGTLLLTTPSSRMCCPSPRIVRD